MVKHVRSAYQAEHTFVQRIIWIRFQEKILQSDHDSIQIEHRLPVLAQDIETDISLQIKIRVVDLSDASRKLIVSTVHRPLILDIAESRMPAMP